MSSSPPFALKGLDHVVLLVTDMDRARRFYCDVVGCSVDRELPEYGMLQLRAGASLIDLVDTSGDEGAWGRPPVEGGRNMDHVCLATRGFEPDELRAHLARHGVEIVEEGVRYGATGDGYSIYFNDPFGNQIELKSAGSLELS
jgi:glyoxylase I family protein